MFCVKYFQLFSHFCVKKIFFSYLYTDGVAVNKFLLQRTESIEATLQGFFTWQENADEKSCSPGSYFK